MYYNHFTTVRLIFNRKLLLSSSNVHKARKCALG